MQVRPKEVSRRLWRNKSKKEISPEGEDKNIHGRQPSVSIVGAARLFACKSVKMSTRRCSLDLRKRVSDGGETSMITLQD